MPSAGGLLQQHPFSRVWATARARAGTPQWATPHDLRHHYAGARTTLDIYDHSFPDEEDRTRAEIDAAL
jgi:hypothetical protein